MTSQINVLGEIRCDSNIQEKSKLGQEIVELETKKRRYESPLKHHTEESDYKLDKENVSKDLKNLVENMGKNYEKQNINITDDNDRNIISNGYISNLMSNNPSGNVIAEGKSFTRRRSSYGGKILGQTYGLVNDLKNSDVSDHHPITSGIVDSMIPQSSNSPSRILVTESGMTPELEAKMKAYQREGDRLKAEHEAWKSLAKERRTALREERRNYEDAKAGCVSISMETAMSYLTSEQRAFLMAKPDYSQYIQQIKLFKEKKKMVENRLADAGALIHRILTKKEKESNDHFDKIFEDFLGFSIFKSPGDILEELQNL